MVRRAVWSMVVVALLAAACGSNGNQEASESERGSEEGAAAAAAAVDPVSFFVWAQLVNDLCEANLQAAEQANAAVEAAATSDEALAALVDSSALFADEVAQIEAVGLPTGNTQLVQEWLELRGAASDLFATAEDATTLDEFLVRSDELDSAFSDIGDAATDLGLDQCTADPGGPSAPGEDEPTTIRETAIADLVEQGFTREEADCILAEVDLTDPNVTSEALMAAVLRCLTLDRITEIGG